MGFKTILVANRGEIAIRIMRTAKDLGIITVAVYSEDDFESLHRTMADDSYGLEGQGILAYLDMDRIIEIAKEAEADAVHPGYGFLSENANFARKCEENGIVFIGPDIRHLELFGNKGRARAAAAAAEVPILKGIDESVTLEQAQAFYESLPCESGMMIKAVGGGGGRGSRAISDESSIGSAYKRCKSEATRAFGNGDLYVEQFVKNARHIEVQILGDSSGEIVHLGERECSVQRRYQKVIEIAPAPQLTDSIRRDIIEAAVRLAKSVEYSNLGTFEFLFDVDSKTEEAFYFIETNARLQVEHTVTEAVTGVDIVQAQIQLAEGATLNAIGFDDSAVSKPEGFAIQTRINMETLSGNGMVKPSGGTLISYEAPSGPGVRTDGFGYAGYTTTPAFDSLLAKVITHSPSSTFELAVQKARRALSEFHIEGLDTNINFLSKVLRHPDFLDGSIHTRWVDERLSELADDGPDRLLGD